MTPDPIIPDPEYPKQPDAVTRLGLMLWSLSEISLNEGSGRDLIYYCRIPKIQHLCRQIGTFVPDGAEFHVPATLDSREDALVLELAELATKLFEPGCIEIIQDRVEKLAARLEER